MKRNLRVELLGALFTGVLLVAAACPGPQGTVVKKQHQVPDTKGKDCTREQCIKVERWCLHVQPPNPDTRPLIFCESTPAEYNKYKVGDKHPK